MKKYILLLLSFVIALSVNANGHQFKIKLPETPEEKKLEAAKAIVYAGMGLHNVTVDHFSEVLSKVASNPKSEEVLLYRPDKNAPDDYILHYANHLFTHENWQILENRLRTKFQEDYVEALTKNIDANSRDYRKHVLEMTYLAQRIVDRFTVPNFRSVYINWIHSQGIKKEDVNLVIDGIGGKIDKSAFTYNKVSEPKTKDDIVNVDANIPITPIINSNTFAVIIANEKYKKESLVEFAENDGYYFKEYCKKTLGIPISNIHYIPNATLNNVIFELDWLKDVCEAYHGDANIIFYYSGHGVPNSKGAAHLLPVDGTGKNLRTCLSLEELYSTLGSYKAQKITVVMDACFSGAQRSGGMMEAARGVAIKVKQSELKGNMIVLSASKDDETAYSYKQAKHGLFTYYLLKKLQDTGGDVNLGELTDYIQDEVGKTSIVKNGKSQSPTVLYSKKMSDVWRSLGFTGN